MSTLLEKLTEAPTPAPGGDQLSQFHHPEGGLSGLPLSIGPPTPSFSTCVWETCTGIYPVQPGGLESSRMPTGSVIRERHTPYAQAVLYTLSPHHSSDLDQPSTSPVWSVPEVPTSPTMSTDSQSVYDHPVTTLCN